jgi:hypothetical protein
LLRRSSVLIGGSCRCIVAHCRAWPTGCHFSHSEVRESWHRTSLWSLVISCRLLWCLGLRVRSSRNAMLYHSMSSSWCFERSWCVLGSSSQTRIFLRLCETEGEVLGILDAGDETLQSFETSGRSLWIAWCHGPEDLSLSNTAVTVSGLAYLSLQRNHLLISI